MIIKLVKPKLLASIIKFVRELMASLLAGGGP
jgi:hypothetical protein